MNSTIVGEYEVLMLSALFVFQVISIAVIVVIFPFFYYQDSAAWQHKS